MRAIAQQRALSLISALSKQIRLAAVFGLDIASLPDELNRRGYKTVRVTPIFSAEDAGTRRNLPSVEVRKVLGESFLKYIAV
jgi:hypothetical protein